MPALIAIYLLRNRFQRQIVSSLMLWLDTREAREGGRKLRRIQTPLFFLLELLAIVLLVFAAGDPQVRLTTGTRPLVVVLDDSFSMLAGGEASPRAKAAKALGEELRRQNPYSIRFVLAGDRPSVLGEPARSPGEAMPLLEGWRCKAPAARLDDAVALAGELGGELALLLVLTDHAPVVRIPDKSRLQWWSFGDSRPNVAFVNAARTAREGLDRSLFEIANLSPDDATPVVVIETLEGGKILQRNRLQLGPNETQRLIVQFPPNTPAVRGRLDDGVLPIDSSVTLLPAEERPVRVDVRVRDGRIREPVVKALSSARLARLTDQRPQLIFTDRGEEKDAGSAWVVSFLSEKDATAFAGPFVLDRAHPLTEGLSLRGAIWGAGKDERQDGAPIVMAGNVPLMSDVEVATPGGAARHELRFRLKPELSTVQDSPDWPILFWNLLAWRGAALPGLTRPNIRLGEQVVLNLVDYREKVQLTAPGEPARDVIVKGRQVSLRGDELGVHTVKSSPAEFRYAVNALSRDESDLTKATTGKWGDWLDDTSLRLEYRGVYWVLLLVLLGIALLHLMLMARARAS
ncbi:MAG: VWA domain-containing protein [Gemmataceae bacterium]